MAWIHYNSSDSASTSTLSPDQQRLCAYNINWLKAQRETPLTLPPLSSFKAAPQASYKPRSLKAPLNNFKPVRLAALTPYPTNSVSLLDGA